MLTPFSPPVDRRIILVAGMHRSGTSAVARLIHAMGAAVGPPDKLLPANPRFNPYGYWEHVGIIEAHERYLVTLGHDWTTLANFSADKGTPKPRQDLVASLQAVVASIGAADQPLVVKDPRLCLLLPLWDDVVGNPICVVVVRDALKSVASLMSKYPAQFTTHYLLALWQKYLMVALDALRGRRALFVSYDRLIEDVSVQERRLWEGLSSLGAATLRRLGDADLRRVVDVNLDRSLPSNGSQLSADQTRLLEWLRAQSDDESAVVVDPPQLAQPDAALAELEQVRQTYVNYGVQVARQQRQTASVRMEPKRHFSGP